MKFSFSHLIIFVIIATIGYFVEPMFYPSERKETPVVTRDETPKPEIVPGTQTGKEEPVAVVDTDNQKEPEEPEEEFDDGEVEADETDTDSAVVKKMKRIVGEDDGRTPVQEEKFIGKTKSTEWRQPKALERRLAAQLRRRLKGTSQAAVMEYIKDPETRLMLAQWDLLHKSNLDELSKLLKSKDACDSLTPLLNDLQWVSSFVYDGELVDPEVALAMVYHFRQADPNMDRDAIEDNSKVKQGVKRRIAAAVAVVFARNKWYGEDRELSAEEIKAFKDTGVTLPSIGGKGGRRDHSKKDHFRLARERYLFFSQSWEEGTLNTYFGNLPDWLMHITCGWKGNSPFGTATTMRWLRDNTSAVPSRYTGMAYQVSYLPLNKFGDTIFTPQYYEPYNVLYPGNFAKETRDTGAVCGGLSHFGASSACANGVPAVTMGEPGHCAYAVYVNGKWRPSNSISEKRSPHWACWGLYGWSAFQMMTDMYEEGQRTRDAQMVCTLANLLARNKNPNNALKLFEMAVAMQPLYSPVWTDYLGTAAKHLSRNPSKYLGVNDFVCSSVAPKHPEMCARYLTETIYPTLLHALRTPKQKMTAFGSYFENLRENEKAEWDMEKMLDMQYESLSKNGTPAKEAYFKLIAKSVSEHPEFGVALSWGVRKAYQDNKNLGDKVRTMIDRLLAELPDDEEHKPVRRILNAAVVRAAEEMSAHALNSGKRPDNRALDYYMNLVERYTKDYLEHEGKPMPSFNAPKGKLISPGGVVMLGSYHPDQNSIVTHAAALTEKGGHIQSEKGKHMMLTIELPKRSYIGGVVVVPTNGCSSYREWKIEYSVDGKEWKLLSKLPDSREQPQVVVNLEHAINAKFLRIDSGAEQNTGIDFKAVLVYDNSKKSS